MYPKQLLPLAGERTLLQETALRTRGAVEVHDRPIVVCNEAHRFLVAEQLLEVAISADILLEPEGRNTAPAATLAAFHALSESGDNGQEILLLIMPADHVINDESAFLAALAAGETAAASGQLVTFGVVPAYAHTGFGYIEADTSTVCAARVRNFVEKPDAETAANMVASGRYLWNAGIFLFGAKAWLEELATHCPEIVDACAASYKRGKQGVDFLRPDASAFMTSPSDSIDYAVMEKTERAAVVPLDAGWSDVGSWATLHDISNRDSDGNCLSGDVVTVDCRNSYINGTSRLVTAVGVEGLIIVEDKDAVLVASRERCQDVKALVEELQRSDREETRLHRQVFRPWGSYDSTDTDEGFQVKRLIVKPGSVLSLQKHAHRSEHWVVVRGTARITRDDEVFDLAVNESTYIPLGAVHRIENPGKEPLHIIEVQCGDYLGEDDIVRIEDKYGREGTNV
jgi:mannose-1-phosphate guanylyltransferase/mannose-6-phosphate isomerase